MLKKNKNYKKSDAYRLSVAPMMDWTDLRIKQLKWLSKNNPFVILFAFLNESDTSRPASVRRLKLHTRIAAPSPS
jgi:tRNA-dihydrouridine synthase